ncbi:hypothetical protein CIB84_004665 [Bambusicola thoracicus]|uniref:Calcium-activated chloride channel N-terminal domain-containing protein n=1 Tax=Bambusicola thoracicus TaxID=9083 RepID=A0A2P4T5H9_BAMTH|nr:hypothetical protein CIB84_004665 [Bambusicola thoracicus]
MLLHREDRLSRLPSCMATAFLQLPPSDLGKPDHFSESPEASSLFPAQDKENDPLLHCFAFLSETLPLEMRGQGQIMGMFRSLIFLLSFQLLHVAKGSMVWLNGSGYEDLVVAINPSVPEDANIIPNTKAMIKDASNYLFEATKHRFFFKSVKIILPKTWTKSSTYSRLKTESYNKADVIIADPYLKHGDDPYTLQYGGCAMKGRYIHFTPKFLLDSSLIKVYGERGRVFVHEWAHLRWGVFDEYNNDAPFYVSENARVEPTSLVPPFETTFQLLQTQDRAVSLVLDVSGSMTTIITNAIGTTYGSEIVLLTDGEDSSMSLCRERVKESGAIIHTIALGPSAAKELEEFSNITGGLQLYAVDVDVPSKLVEAFSEITTGSGDISEQSIQLESKDQEVVSSGWINSTVTIDKTVGNDTFFVFSWSKKQPIFFVRDPKGKEYGSSDFTVDSSNLKTARLSINGTAEVGDWHYYIQNTDTTQTISVTVTSRAASSDVSPVILQAYMERSNIAPYPLVVYAEVSQNFLPVLGATVIATIEKDGAPAVSLHLFDNGTGADMTKNDGIYSRYFTTSSGDGRYSLKVSAQGRDQTIRLGRRQNGALYVPGYIENGKIQMNAPRPELADEDIQANLGSFSRTSTSSFKLDSSGISPTSSPQGFPPCKITDLDAYIDNETVVLTWTAPGGDFDSGKADHYIIKTGANLWSLRDGFENATSVDSSHLTPQEAGSTETLKFKPEHLTIENEFTHKIFVIEDNPPRAPNPTSTVSRAEIDYRVVTLTSSGL